LDSKQKRRKRAKEEQKRLNEEQKTLDVEHERRMKSRKGCK
jgi:hypothetical protein